MKKNILLIGLISLSVTASAHEIGKKALEDIKTPDFTTDELAKYRWEKNHEKLTALSLQCLADANKGKSELANKPEFCERREIELEQMSLYNGSSDYPKVLDQYRSLINQVRWPDDPTRQVYEKDRSAAKFAATMEEYCGDILEDDGKIDLAENGLLCASHYGKFQFFHSMATKDGVDAETTFNEIKDWIGFAFQFSKNQKLRDDDYCTYWGNNTEFPSIKEAMSVESARARGFCQRRKISFFSKLFNYKLWGSDQDYYEAWDVKTLFNHSCENPFGSGDCTVVEDDKEISFSALGAVTHVIQDSFSKSHANRGLTGTSPEITCKPIKSFYSYFEQDVDKHSLSDKWPKFNESCDKGQSETLDPVTAVAQLIWHHSQDELNSEEVAEIVDSVFKIETKDAKSVAGTAYAKK